MLSEVYSNIYSVYESFRGDGKIMALIFVALLFLYMCRKAFDFNPFMLIISPIAAIGIAIEKVIEYAQQRAGNEDSQNDGNNVSPAVRKYLIVGFTAFLMIFTIMISGHRVYSAKHVQKADNMLHIPADYVEVMDYILSQDIEASVVAMPDYSMYHGIYSSKFNMLYELSSDDDFRYLSEDARNAFLELSDNTPDMKKLADAAIHSGCNYIILKKDYYWSELPITRFGFENAASFDNWDVYVRREAAYEQ